MTAEGQPASDWFEQAQTVVHMVDEPQHLWGLQEAGIDAGDAAAMERFSTEMLKRTLLPRSEWDELNESGHFVQLYESEDFLLRELSRFVGTGLGAGDAAIVIATEAHRAALADQLQANGLDVPGVVASGRYIPLDAAELLAAITVDGLPEAGRCTEILGGIIERAAEGGRRVRVFGEMVALLWAEGNHAAAIQLEGLWNDLQRRYAFSLCCGYPMHGFKGEALAESLEGVCAEHSRVIPAESYSALADTNEQLRAIALLQQKAHSLEVEVAARKQAAERFRFLAESVPEKIFTAHSNGDVDYVNRQWLDLTDLPAEQILSRGWTQVVHPDDLAETLDRWQRSLDTGEPFELEHRFRRADGGYCWHLTRAHALRDGKGAVVTWIGSSTDIDDQKQREIALDRSIHLRDEFLSIISHDLKTPLTVLQGQAQVLQRRATRGTLDEEVLMQGLRQIEDRSRRMTELIGELLDVMQLRAGEELQLDRRMVDLVALARDVVAGQEGLADDHHLLLETSETELTGWWDRLRLRRVVENLIGNAVKYSPDGGEIVVTLARERRSEGDRAVLTVQDQGIGIAAEDLPHIFQQFYRGKNAAGEIVGTGLGLAGVCHIVEQHGGTIGVESVEGKGSTFTVRLPLDLSFEPF